ncbi:penicillin-insensitive murein endopeptidase [Marinobacter zhejiangensis]|uniref:Penicillin-insensitive murein endopeptidase n=1 Tax=Marinobacter zhejiangensis TaxID=488535 RepID=A0A1I4P1R5_9GAMM|nr:penicillin-insensitive murein endopeptidase [Marinobacter zhejiangensis]SFM21712.1 penicillin-insensitive murein endopeptidase [Marinobacter zhejiangensis]
MKPAPAANALKLALLITALFPSAVQAEGSTCFGTTSAGHLEAGVQLPASGENFTGYSTLARWAGRTYVHSDVRDIVVAAYETLEAEHPEKVYKYAETGFREGGEFSPHKTHRNGLSVDFMTPVVDDAGHSVHLPTTPFNKFGYNIEFDDIGHYEGMSIDYDAMAAHIVALHKQAISRGFDVWRVIFDPELQAPLYNTQYSDYLRQNIEFSARRSWVRHDEHYHVDFEVPCQQTGR